MSPNPLLHDRNALERWIASLIASTLEIDPVEIDIDTRFDRYGVDSAAAIVLAEELERRLGMPLEPTVLYEYPTIRSLCGFLMKTP
jgi:acyl carrier protein